MTPGDAAKKLRTLPEILKRERANALRRVVRVAQRDAVKRLQGRGVGRALWGGGGRHAANAKGARLVVKSQRVKTSADGSMKSGLELKGLAGMVEAGGRTKAHAIKPKNASVLLLKLPGGVAFARGVQHPGSNIPSQPFGKPALQAAAPLLAAELEKGHRNAIQKFEGQ